MIMKRHLDFNFKTRFIFSFLFSILLLGGGNLFAQEEDTNSEKDTRPVENTFESIWLIDNQTVMVPIKGTFEFDILHRFGVVSNGYDDFFGFFAPSNLRLGFNYVPIDRLQVGFGVTKERRTWDLNVKYAILKQGISGGFPVSISYLASMGIDARDKDKLVESLDRYSYFHQLMVARKVTNALSLQVSGNLSYRNLPEEVYDVEGVLFGRMSADHISISLLGRYKITDDMAFIFNYDHPISSHEVVEVEPEPNLGFGIEITTSSHAFQIFAGNYQSIVPQLNHTRNKNKISDGDFAIGFNMTRLMNW